MAAREHGAAIATRVRTSDVVAYRVHAHHLDTRQPANQLSEVAGTCGVQNSPPGSALLALHARVEGVSQDMFDQLIGEEKGLLQTWSVRGAPFLFPTSDAAVFTIGVLPATEKARLHLIAGVERALQTLDMSLDEAVDLIAGEIDAVLAQRNLAITALGRELAERVGPMLTPVRRADWERIGPYGANQPLGEAVVHFCLRILTLRGTVCFAPRSGNTAPFVLVEDWLGRPLPQVDPRAARQELLRRYLHCYGPSTPGDFAAWVGVRAADADPWWTTLEDELAPVEFDGRRAWIHADDLDSLRSQATARGVRMLPPSDPYTQMRDRGTIVDPTHRREVWKAIGAPGTVLVDGTIAGIWRPRARGRTLTLTVTMFRSPNTSLRRKVQEAANEVAAVRGAASVRLVFDDTAHRS